MKNLSVKTRLGILLGLPIIAMVLLNISALSIMSRSSAGVNTIYFDRVEPLSHLKVIADSYAVSVIDAVNKGNAGLMSVEAIQRELTSAKQAIDSHWKTYMATTLTEEEAQLAKQASALFAPANAAIASLERFLSTQKGSIPDTLKDFDGPLYAAIDPISSKISELRSSCSCVSPMKSARSSTTWPTTAVWPSPSPTRRSSSSFWSWAARPIAASTGRSTT